MKRLLVVLVLVSIFMLGACSKFENNSEFSTEQISTTYNYNYDYYTEPTTDFDYNNLLSSTEESSVVENEETVSNRIELTTKPVKKPITTVRQTIPQTKPTTTVKQTQQQTKPVSTTNTTTVATTKPSTTASTTSHTHDFAAANCNLPKTCKSCGATEGNELGHSFADATCISPKKCKMCGVTEGNALGHKFSDATCTTPKKCKVCGLTEGNALGHSYAEATCSAPKTCKICGDKVGASLSHDYKDATCDEPKTCKLCGVKSGEALGHDYNDATCNTPKTCQKCGKTSGSKLEHNYVEKSASDGHKVGSVITYECSNCNSTKSETIKPLTVSATQSSATIINGWYSSIGFRTNVTGGYGKYQYKYEVYLSETSTSPALTEDFSENSSFGWSSRFYCNDNMLVITVKDEAGNQATHKVVV